MNADPPRAQRLLNLSQLALIRKREALLFASVDLLKALGGRWKDDEPLAARSSGGRP